MHLLCINQLYNISVGFVYLSDVKFKYYKIMKVFLKLCLSFLLISLYAISVKAESDFNIIYKRMFEKYLQNPSIETIDNIINMMNNNGGFYSIDYSTTTGEPKKHLTNIYKLASAYINPNNYYYKNEQIREKYILGLKYWIKVNHKSSNWWFRSIAYPKELAKGIIVMANEIKKEKQLFEDVVRYLYFDFENRKIKDLYSEGANGADIIISAIGAAVLTENNERMIQFKDVMTHLLEIQPLRGILKDYQFAQHCGHGRQIYTLSYGREFVKSMISYIEFCNGTKYQTGNLDIFQDFFVNAVQWLFYSGSFDPNTMGRKISSTFMVDEWIDAAFSLTKIEGFDSELMNKVYKRISGENTLKGNKMYWRVDYMSHHGNGFMASSRMTSSRTVGNEAGNGEGLKNFYSSNGVNYIFVTGKEYDREYFDNFNSRQFPGITAEQDTDTVPVPDWGEFGSNGNGFAGGASDGKYGACGMILDRRNLTAHKSWFYFDDEFVCLGSGISMNNGKDKVYTTLNQCNIDGDIICNDGNKIFHLSKSKDFQTMKWLLHGNIGYMDLTDNSMFNVTLEKSILSLNINHGINPDNDRYAYLVKPFVYSEKEFLRYVSTVSDYIYVISNSNEVHSVYNKKDNVLAAIFYKEGSVSFNDIKVETDTPCVMLWNLNDNTISVSNPYCELRTVENINLRVKKNNKINDILFNLPLGEEAGKSVTKKL